MVIDVRHEDIRDGERCEPSTCPVVRAIRRQTGMKRVRMDTCDAVWFDGVLVWLPFQEALRVQTFDKTGQMMPHEFDFPVNR
jgi:hypothetical protein